MNHWTSLAGMVTSGWLAALGRALWPGSLGILLAAAACRLLTGLSPSVRSWLWRAAYLKLFLALLWTTPFLLPLLRTAPAPVAVGGRLSKPGGITRPGVEGNTGPLASETALGGSAPAASSPLSRVSALVAQAAAPFGMALWLLGAGLCAGGLWRRLRAVGRLQIGCRRLEDLEAYHACGELCALLGIRRAPLLLQSDGDAGPLLVGLRRPAIILPASVVGSCDAAELRLILAHELAHLRRRDLWWGWLPLLARVLFFFHPLVWLAERELRDAQEMDCDERAVSAAGVSAVEYGGVLLKVAERCRPGARLELATVAVVESFETLRRRLLALESVGRRRSGWRLAGAALLGATLLGLVPCRFVSYSAEPSPSAAAEAPLFDWEADAQGWVSRVPGSVTVTHDPDHVRVGAGALEWSYDLRDPYTRDVMLARKQPELPGGATTLDFWLRTSAASSFQLYLTERDGSVYHMHLQTPADRWRRYQVRCSDLVLGETQDGNGALDLDQVQEIVLQDLSRYHSAPGDLGPRRVWLDGLTFTNQVIPQRRLWRVADGTAEVLFDDFDGDFVGWASNIHTDLKLAQADGRSVLRAQYRQGSASADRFQITNHFDPRYAGLKGIRVVARAAQRTRLDVALREFDGSFTGPEYHAFCELPAGTAWQTRFLPLREFRPIAPGVSSMRPVDPARVWLLLVGDATPSPDLLEGPRRAELEIDSLSAVLHE